MGTALKEAYSDIFLIKANPGPSDKDLVQGKFKSYHNASDNVAKLHTNTFYALLDLADLSSTNIQEPSTKKDEPIELDTQQTTIDSTITPLSPENVGLHYNIQIHLPATKDVEVYNAIFKSLKEKTFEISFFED